MFFKNRFGSVCVRSGHRAWPAPSIADFKSTHIVCGSLVNRFIIPLDNYNLSECEFRISFRNYDRITRMKSILETNIAHIRHIRLKIMHQIHMFITNTELKWDNTVNATQQRTLTSFCSRSASCSVSNVTKP